MIKIGAKQFVVDALLQSLMGSGNQTDLDFGFFSIAQRTDFSGFQYLQKLRLSF